METVADTLTEDEIITPEEEIADLLKVDDFEEQKQDPVLQNQEVDRNTEEDQENQGFDKQINPKKSKQGIKTRADLIAKIQESAEFLKNEPEIKQLRLHRRRRNSLEKILRSQVDRAVLAQAEREIGIPEEHEARVSYAVDMLYNFDLMICKAIEKGCELVNIIPIEVKNLSETIDNDPRIKGEIKKGFSDWIKESPGMQGWVDQMASPSTRILLCHLYPLMHCLKLKERKKTKELSSNIKMKIAAAKMRGIIDPPRSMLKRDISKLRRPLPKIQENTIKVV